MSSICTLALATYAIYTYILLWQQKRAAIFSLIDVVYIAIAISSEWADFTITVYQRVYPLCKQAKCIQYWLCVFKASLIPLD